MSFSDKIISSVLCVINLNECNKDKNKYWIQ